MSKPPDNLIEALQGIAKVHDAADLGAVIEFMDTSEELYLRWDGAYVRRAWFTDQFSAEQQVNLAEFDAFFQSLSEKYNKFPPILKLMASADGRKLAARALRLLQELDAP